VTAVLEEVILAAPRGFCAGVVRAIEIVEIALETFGPPVYVRKEIVHNRHVVESLRARGAVFIDEVDEAPDGAVLIFSAHGVAPEVRRAASRRDLRVIDATCPLVTKVHLEALRFARQGYTIVLIGHRGHDEVIGTMGEAPESIVLVENVEDVQRLEVTDPAKVAVLTQTTLSVDDTREILEALQRRFPAMAMPSRDDICYATQNRQQAVKELARQVDLVLVIGAANSSNSRRLVEVARSCGVRAHLIADAEAIEPAWLEGVRRVGVTAGASAPEVLVHQVVAALQQAGARRTTELAVVQEHVHFALPRELAAVARHVAS